VRNETWTGRSNKRSSIVELEIEDSIRPSDGNPSRSNVICWTAWPHACFLLENEVSLLVSGIPTFPKAIVSSRLSKSVSNVLDSERKTAKF
jgi:hypothetical protein